MKFNLSTCLLSGLGSTLCVFQASASLTNVVEVQTSIKHPTVKISDVQRGDCPTGGFSSSTVYKQNDNGTMDSDEVLSPKSKGCFRVTIQYSIPEETRDTASDGKEKVVFDQETVHLPYSSTNLNPDWLKGWTPGRRAELAAAHFKVASTGWNEYKVKGFFRYGDDGVHGAYDQKFEDRVSTVRKFRIAVTGRNVKYVN